MNNFSRDDTTSIDTSKRARVVDWNKLIFVTNKTRKTDNLYDMISMMLDTKDKRVIYISLVLRIASICLVFDCLLNVVQHYHVCQICMSDWRTSSF